MHVLLTDPIPVDMLDWQKAMEEDYIRDIKKWWLCGDKFFKRLEEACPTKM